MQKKYTLFVVIVIPILVAACGFTVTRGSGVIESETRPVSDFDQLELSGLGVIYITQGTEETLKIEAEDNVLPAITTAVRNGVLQIGFDENNWPNVVQPTETIRYYLTVKDLERIELSGAGGVEADQLSATNLVITSSGAGDIQIDQIAAKTLDVALSGAGSCQLGGEVATQNIEISGAGNYSAAELQSQTAKIAVSGLGSVEIWATDTLDVDISGAGSVKYYGTPSVSQDISGAGSIKNAPQD